jgi:hypothetical protein
VELAAIDRNLNRLRETVAAMSTNLVDLESDAARLRLDQTPLTGVTAARWTQGAQDLAGLWQWYTQLNEVLEKAAQLRGSRAKVDTEQLTQLDWLVNGPSIELSKTDVPLSQRGLFGPAETTIRCSPPELLDRMRTAFDQVVAVIGACHQRWSAVELRLRPLEDQLAQTQRLADLAGESHRPELDRARAQLEEVRRAVMCDPLTVGEASLDGVAASLGSVADDLRRLLQLRDNLATGIDQARGLMAQLRTTTAGATAARAEALVKIAHPAVVDPLPVADRVEQDLDRVTALSAQGDWRAAGNLLVQWTTRCRDALAEAERALAANRAPLAARDELRGRLDAYRAKAYRLGRLEEPATAALYARAQSVLFTAPTDLVAADTLVRQYQQALAGPASREVDA